MTEIIINDSEQLEIIYKSIGLWFVAGLTFGFIGIALAYAKDLLKYFGLK